MDAKEARRIADNLMYELEIHNVYQETIEKLVSQHWPKRSCIYRYICNIVKGSKIVDKTRNWYIVHWNQRQCETLMKDIANTTVIQIQRRWRHPVMEDLMLELKVYK